MRRVRGHVNPELSGDLDAFLALVIALLVLVFG